jgi:alpha-glucosidase
LGCLSAKTPHDLALPLSFLRDGSYTADTWKDAPDAEIDPNHLVTEKFMLSRTDTLKLHVALDGGFVTRLTPLNSPATHNPSL